VALPKHPGCGVPGIHINSSKPDENPSEVQRKRDEVITSTDIDPYKS